MLQVDGAAAAAQEVGEAQIPGTMTQTHPDRQEHGQRPC